MLTMPTQNSHTEKRRGRGPTALAASIAKVTGKAIRRRGLASASVVTDWPRIVGEPLASNSLPERLTLPRDSERDARRSRLGGILHLRVAGAWATEVQHLEPVIIERINRYFGYRAVGRLRILQGPLPLRPAPKSKPRRMPEAAELKAIDDQIAVVEDDDLRASLASLGRAIATDPRRAS